MKSPELWTFQNTFLFILAGETPNVTNSLIGCFTNDDLDAIAPTFLLYDKENRDFAVELKANSSTEHFENFPEDGEGFDKDKDLKILVQGVWSPNLYGLLEHVKEAFFDQVS